MFFVRLFTNGESAHHKMGRNELCYCGSGKKYKKCHMPSDVLASQQQAMNERFADINRQSELTSGSPAMIADRGLRNASGFLEDIKKGSKK